MSKALRQHPNIPRAADRIPLRANLSVRTLEGERVCPLARCTEIGIGGLRVTAAIALPPGARVDIELDLPFGGHFSHRGSVVWSKQTVHPPLFGSPTGHDDDALFGIAFEAESPEALYPIARLFAARDQELKRAHRIRRLHGLSNRA